MLEINQLKAGYKDKVIAEVPHLTLSSGEHCLILGDSGSGKTTLLCTIAGLLTPLGGAITVNGQNLGVLKGSVLDAFRGSNIGIIYQTLHMVSALTVLENVLLAQYSAGVAQDRGRALGLLEQLGVEEKKNDLPETLSQGQQQRVAIARAAINSPRIIVGDEPTSALDDKACETVMSLLLQLAASSNASLIIATHDQRIKGHFHKEIRLGGVR
jgi:ABC-type lipoprotein export system ATPase subunit